MLFSWRRSLYGRCEANRDADLRTIERRTESRLRRDQRKNPRRFEALHLQADTEAAAYHAGDTGDIERRKQGNSAPLRRLYEASLSERAPAKVEVTNRSAYLERSIHLIRSPS